MSATPPHQPNSEDDAAMRAAARGDMLRANTAVTIVLGALLTLVFAAELAGIRATQNQHRAEQAEAIGQTRLAGAYFAQARADRLAVAPGRRQLALNAISNAAAISTSTDLRSEAAACLALTDLEPAGPLVPTPRGVSHLAMSANLKYCAWADAENRITISAEHGQETFNFSSQQPVQGLSFSPDGHWLAVRQPGDLVEIYDVEAKQVLPQTLHQAGVVTSFSQDSKRLIFCEAGSNRLVTVCDLPDCRLTKSSIQAGSQLFRTSADMKKIAMCNGTDVDIFDFPSGSNRLVLPHNSVTLVLAWSTDGNKLAVSCVDGDIHLWDLPGRGHKILTGHSDMALSLGFSENGRLLFSSSRDETTRLWDTALGKTIAVGQGTGQEISPDGQRIGFWRTWIGYGVWNVSASQVYSVLPCDPGHGPLFNVDLSKSGHWCVGMQNNGFSFWDLRAEDQGVFYPVPELYDIFFSPDEQSLLLCRKSGLEIWPLQLNGAGQLEPQIAAARKIPLPDGQGTRAAAVSDHGNLAVVELTDRRFLALDLAGQRPAVMFQDQWQNASFKGPGTATGAGRFAISPDGKWVVTGFGFGTGPGPKVWDAASGKLVTSLSAGTSMAGFSPDGHWLGLAGMSDFSFWSVGDWQPKSRLDRTESAITLGALAFGPDATSAAFGRTRQVIEIGGFLSRHKQIDLISPETQSINAVRLTRDGSTLVTATANNLVEVWRLGKLQDQLAAMGLGQQDSPASTPARGHSSIWPASNEMVTFVAAMTGFLLAAGYTLRTLRRHRRAIERFVQAETKSAQRNRELSAAKIELLHSQKMQALGTLATGIAHDFNNLLSVIRMSNKLVGRRTANDPEIQENVADIEQAVLQGKAVVSSMLGYAKTHADHEAPVDVATVVEDVVALLSKEFLRGITLDLKVERTLSPVKIGRGALEQILLNLVVNASEAMQGNGKLSIQVRETAPPATLEYVLRPRSPGAHVELTVVDSGPGITPELRDRIFEPFFTTKRGGAKSGTGLGLSLVYSLAEQTGSGLAVKTGSGAGAEFRLFLPLKA